jgi:hypothetical protein
MDKEGIRIRRVRSAEEAQDAFCCMTEVATPWPEALRLCREWLADNLCKGVEGYHLQAPGGEVVGHLYYAHSDRALIPYRVEPGVSVIYCEWVQRKWQSKGFGRQLYKVFEEEMVREGMKGILVEATEIEGKMHYGHFEARGYEQVSARGPRRLMYHPLAAKQVEVEPLPMRSLESDSDRVEVVIVNGFACPYEAATVLMLKEVASEFGDRVVVREVWVTPEKVRQYGVSQGIFINGKQKLGGAETEEAVRKALREEL